ncbi:MAG TPA: flagellar hook-basal body protein [Bacillales bacterium]|nr:flagellar hook-basal body protein [Bacillales bacterium]
MLRGFYTAASGMLAQQRRTEMLTNNIANANTPGFKEDQTSLRDFPKLLMKHFDNQTSTEKTVGLVSTGVYLQEAIPKFIQGDVRETGNKTDMALIDINMPAKSSVFFTVQAPSGERRYTRNGNFTLDPEGYLTTSEGLYLLDQQGQRIQLSSDKFTLSENGLITGQNGEQAQLGIAFSNNPQSLIKEGNGLYKTENGTALPNAVGVQYKVQQGVLEQSNVDVTRAMTEMLTAYRSFEANQKVLQAYDRSMEKVANEIGKI